MRRRLLQSRTRLGRFVAAWAIRRAKYRPERNPKIIVILTCIGINLTPTAIGFQALPGSLENAPAYIGQAVTAFAALGCFMCVLGLLLWGRLRDVGLAIEIAGTILLAAGMLFYSGALFAFTDPNQRAYAFGASFGIGIGSILRAGQIALYVRGRRLIGEDAEG